MLVGWRKEITQSGCVFKLEIAGSKRHVTTDAREVEIALTDDQICSLARDLHRTASRRGLDIYGQKSVRSQGFLARIGIC
jgi:hypothetical protein